MASWRDLNLDGVKRAREMMKDVIHLTPLAYSGFFSRTAGSGVYLKLENMQKTGSFKIRGAYNKISQLPDDDRARGVVAASAGNHAQGVALASSLLGIESTIVMPEGSPIAKIMASRDYGAEVILSGRHYDDAHEKALLIGQETGSVYIHGFDDMDIITGQATVGLEILDQLPDISAVVVPVGGGGLIAGISFAIKTLKPDTRVIGVQASGSPAAYLSRKAGKPVQSVANSPIADGISVGKPGSLTMEIIREYVDDIILVSDQDIARTILTLLERVKVMAEGAGAAGLAAILQEKIRLPGKKVVAVISGGNIDVNLLAHIIERGLIESGRRLRFKTVISDLPGSLQKIVALVSGQQVSIISIIHDRTSLNVPIRYTQVEFVLETMDRNHVERVIRSLEKEGYSLEVV